MFVTVLPSQIFYKSKAVLKHKEYFKNTFVELSPGLLPLRRKPLLEPSAEALSPHGWVHVHVVPTLLPAPVGIPLSHHLLCLFGFSDTLSPGPRLSAFGGSVSRFCSAFCSVC